jgi:hypothetical protein
LNDFIDRDEPVDPGRRDSPSHQILSCRSTRNYQFLSQFCSQFRANSQNAESNLT